MVLHVGKLLEKAKENVINKGYNFVKGQSRGCSRPTGESSGSSSGDQQKKRPKLEQDERQREIQSIKEIISNINEQLQLKKLRLQKQKSLNLFATCDQISEEIRKLMNEKKIKEKQLLLLEKKEKESTWYRNKNAKNQSKSTKKGKKGRDLRELWKSGPSGSGTKMNKIQTSDSNDSECTLVSTSDSELTTSIVGISVQPEADKAYQSNAQFQMAEAETNQSPQVADEVSDQSQNTENELTDLLPLSQHLPDESRDQSQNPS